MKPVALLFTTAAVIAISSCRKAEVDNDTQSAVDYSLADNFYSDIVPSANRIIIGTEGVKDTAFKNMRIGKNMSVSAPTCANVYIASYVPNNNNNQDSIFPVVVMIDYGSGGCVDIDGKVRKGKIRLTFDDYFSKAGSTMTAELIDYFVNDVKIEGTLLAKRVDDYTITYTLSNGKCIDPSWTITYTCNRTIKLLEGYATETDPTDDVFQVEGEGKGTNRNNINYTCKITSPIVKRASCKWISKGTIEIAQENKAPRIVDFGDGNCDNKASVTINGNVFEFTMK